MNSKAFELARKAVKKIDIAVKLDELSKIVELCMLTN